MQTRIRPNTHASGGQDSHTNPKMDYLWKLSNGEHSCKTISLQFYNSSHASNLWTTLPNQYNPTTNGIGWAPWWARNEHTHLLQLIKVEHHMCISWEQSYNDSSWKMQGRILNNFLLRICYKVKPSLTNVEAPFFTHFFFFQTLRS